MFFQPNMNLFNDRWSPQTNLEASLSLNDQLFTKVFLCRKSECEEWWKVGIDIDDNIR